MIFFFVSLLIFCATVALYFSLLLRKREQSTQKLKERVGVAKPVQGEWAPLAVERDERLSAIPAIDRVLRGLAIARRLELLLYQAGMSIRVGSFLLLIALLGSTLQAGAAEGGDFTIAPVRPQPKDPRDQSYFVYQADPDQVINDQFLVKSELSHSSSL